MEKKSSQYAFSMTGFREGRQLDFNYAYEIYYDKIYSFAYNLISNETEAQDITTDTFVKLWRLRENFENLGNIKAFLYITCRNACTDFLRHLKVERKTHGRIRYSQKIEELLPNEIMDAEDFIKLARLIEQLPGKCRKIFEFIYYNNMNTSEIAREMCITNQNVLNQKRRAIHILRTGLMQQSL